MFAVAFVIRFAASVVSDGGPGRYSAYDPGVYYAAADALSFGRLPYRDFVFLHPPGITITLTPFAVLGRATSDHTGYAAGAVAFMLLGAVNAVLVMRVARGMQLPGLAALAGGACYALWFGAVDAEVATRLEPLGNFAILCGLLAYLRAQRSSGRARAWLSLACGFAFAAAASVKIWWALALVILIAWHTAASSRRREVRWVVLGAALAGALIDGPFFARAPGRMWQMVVTEQLNRSGVHRSPLTRIRGVTGVEQLDGHLPNGIIDVTAFVFVATFVIAMVLAWRQAAARLVVVLALFQAILLMGAPSWFAFYADYLTPAAALVVAAAVAGLPHDRSGSAERRVRGIGRMSAVAASGPLWVAAVVTASYFAVDRPAPQPLPGPQLLAAVRPLRCVMSDAPSGLIMLDALSSGLSHGCRNWVDVTGRTYGVDSATRPGGGPGPRVRNPRWQRDLLDYLQSGDAVLIVRAGQTGIAGDTMTALRSGGVLAASNGYVVYRTRPVDSRAR